MVKAQAKKRLIVTLIVLAVILLVVAGVYARYTSQTRSDTDTKTTSAADIPPKATTTETDKAEETKPASEAVAVDPESLSSVAIEPLGVTVFYTKGTPGFDYSIKKTADSTQYADFTSTDLVGTKCTDDDGLFASIIKNPASSGADTTISKTVKVGDDTYGLSLTGAGCTNNTELLSKYQNGFSEGFTSLTAL